MVVKISGPTPKESDKRLRVNKDTFSPNTVIYQDGVLRGPRLPTSIPWCSRTKKWWETWRRSPQAQLMEETDWDAMLEAALIHNEIWSAPDMHKASEITTLTKELHRILSAYGMSYLDRLKLRVKIDNDRMDESLENSEVPDNVVSMYQKRLAA